MTAFTLLKIQGLKLEHFVSGRTSQRTKPCYNCGLPNWAIWGPGTVRLRLKGKGPYHRDRRLTVWCKGGRGRPRTHKNVAARMRAYRARQSQRQGAQMPTPPQRVRRVWHSSARMRPKAVLTKSHAPDKYSRTQDFDQFSLNTQPVITEGSNR